ncbi:MAG: toll/interleukin-1 receptor domain-containing protein, partial [Promethearchaeia archaeon]
MIIKSKQEETLIKEAKIEEKNFNWLIAVKLYKQAANSFLNKKITANAAYTYKKLGYTYSRVITTVKSAEEFVEYIKYTIETYNKTADLFKKIENKAEELECKAEALFFSQYFTNSIVECNAVLSKSNELFTEAIELYSKEDDQASIARILSRIAISTAQIAFFNKDPKEIIEIYRKGIDIAHKAQKLSKEVKNMQSLVESMLAEWWLTWSQIYIKNFRWDEYWREYFREFLSKCEESLELIKNYDNIRSLEMIYQLSGTLYCFFGNHYIEDEIKQEKYFNKGFELLEKSLDIARKIKDNFEIYLSLFWLNWWALLGGRIEYLQKRILVDLPEIVEIGKIFKNLIVFWNYLSNEFAALYYANIAQRSFFTQAQRKSYAEKGIEYAKEGLKNFSSLPSGIWFYQALTWSHSQLAILTEMKKERIEHARKMLLYAKQIEKIAKKYEGGFTKSSCYSSLYKAYKTFADIAENREERINMLTEAIDAQTKYLPHAIESRTGIIQGKIRLGLLYEEIGILTQMDNNLIKAKETFSSVIKECLERGYHSYAAATHIYIAHIEDRLSKHTISAEHYKIAQETYKKSLENIEYKLLKKRINEKIAYAGAWNLIEMAKVYHKREDHLKAKNFYEQACKILQELLSYSYEASYYSAWSLQEEAEKLSKQEAHNEAIEKYEATRESFEKAIERIKDFYKRSTDKLERVRLEKLEKLAIVRMNYCSARINVEEARILGKHGEHYAAAEKFTLAASQFREICLSFKNELERGELEAVYNLCRAWESMELAEKYGDPNRFGDAANLFAKASELFTDSKLKLLTTGNSAFCQALEHGCLFDESIDTEIKAKLYPKVKLMLRKAASSYEKGGFVNGADWALATSSYFDATWHLIRADEELDINKKKNLLSIGANYLQSAAELFGNSGYKDKEREVLERLDRIIKEEKILVSALNTIKKPSISSSIEGIIAPACPIETSQSPRISEIRQFSEETRRFLEKDGMKAEVTANIKIFISYATADSTYFQVSKIATLLGENPEIEGVLYWEEDLQDDIYDYMNKNLAKCDAFLLFCSENANHSEPVQMEWKAALKIKKKIIPIFVKESDIPPL